MSLQIEHHYIKKCRQLIESRMEWKEGKEWRHRDYEYLSELIFQKTRISISVSTLKRIWQSQSQRTPHVSTLNAMARFLDYKDWNTFKAAVKQAEQSAHKKPASSPINPNQVAKIVMVALIFIWATVGIIYLFVRSEPKQSTNDQFENIKADKAVFASKKTVTSGLPNSVIFEYDLQGLSIDSAFIQQDWDERKRTRISVDDHYHTSIYYYPGYYNAKLVLNNSIVKEHPLFITTDGWMATYQKDIRPDIPVYLKNIDLIKENRLLVSLEDLKTNKIEHSQKFLIGLYNYQDFGTIDCNNFRFETNIKNSLTDGGLTCQYVMVALEGQGGIISSVFCDPGCVSNAELHFADTYLNGKNNDLSAFGTKLEDWRNIQYEVKNKQARILLDNQEIYRLTFTRDIGRVIGIYYLFYGCGSVKETKLFDADNTLVYEDSFASTN